MNPPEQRGKIPNFSITGSNRPPQVLSNKVILTPISPGNQRGSIWSENKLQNTAWTADVEFRANGPERGGGNLNIWLARDGNNQIGSSSIYTVNRFEGLALVVDAHGGSGGMLRAFPNDGSVDYGSRPSVDELAFGHCMYSYRNLGRPSQIKMRQSGNSFKVEIDGAVCFESDKVVIPPGYNFGITAATPDTPDSFEVFKLVVMSDANAASNANNNNNNNNNANNGGTPYSTRNQVPPKDQKNVPIPETDDGDLPDVDAEVFMSSKEQFQDLHNRLQSMNHQVSSVYRSVSRHHQLDEQRHSEVKNLVAELKEELAKLNEVQVLRDRIKDLEKEVRGMRNDVNKKISAHERTFKGYLSDHHATLSQTMIDSMPGHKRLILVIIGTQIILVGAYVAYKRRRASSPKKYL